MLSRVILFVVAIGIIALGAYCAIDGLLWSDRPSVNSVVVGPTIGTAGWHILWAVFIAPMFGMKAE
jgi:hypothetical protein